MGRRRRPWLWVAIAAVVILVLALARCTTEAPPKRGAPGMQVVRVTTAIAARSSLPVHLDTIGTVTSLNTVSITSQVTGVIKAVHYAEGQIVRRGTPLVEIDSRPFRASVQQAEGTLHHDEQLLAQARMDLDRYRRAWAQHAIAKQILDDQEHVVLQLEGTVHADEGAVENAKVQLAYTSIKAPIAGRVGLRLVDPGNLVTANAQTPLVVITQIAPISVVFPVSEEDLGRLANAGRLPVTVFDRSRTHALATGELTTLDNQIDPTTGTVRARAVFANSDAALFPNQFVNTRVLVTTLTNVITVPSSAIQRDGPKVFVYMTDTSRAHIVNVQVGETDGERTQVIGLAPGTHVATSSFEKLREGVPVTTDTQVRFARPARGGTR